MEKQSEQKLQEKLEKSLKIIREYDWLLNACVLDFYVSQHWSKIPFAWQQSFERLQPECLTSLVNGDANGVVVWPLTLLALKQCLHDLCISRQQSTVDEIDDPTTRSTLTTHPKLRHIFTKCVKPKKRHEIEQMATICQRSCVRTPVNFVVDFGAGLGHLARVLGYGCGIRVCCLEMQNELNEQARKIDAQLETTALKLLSPVETAPFQRPTHVTLRLTADMQSHEFLATISAALQLPNTHDYQFGIIGLHPCGDLCSILLRMFLNCSQARFLNFVGCCYMKLSTSNTHPTTAQVGYPLSKFLRQSPQLSQLSYEAREISCHAIEVFSDRLSAGSYEHLKIHSYRAAAERILIKHWPELKHCGLRSVKHVPDMQFEEYFYRAVRSLPAANLHPTELQNTVTTSDLRHWQSLVIFYTLRLMLAPLVESVVLFDRILFLKENGCEVEINAIFDPRISPRNHITSAVKRS